MKCTGEQNTTKLLTGKDEKRVDKLNHICYNKDTNKQESER